MDATDRGDEGPRERLQRMGSAALSDEELVALLLGTGGAGEPVTVLAARLLREVGGLGGLARDGRGGLAARRGLGATKAARIVAALELGRRLGAAPWSLGRAIVSSADVRACVSAALASAEREHLLALALDVRHRLLAEVHVAVGGQSGCAVVPADLFRLLLREAAARVIVVHNHPSGDPTPSPDDIALTARLVNAGAMLGIPVVDHVIIGRESHFSFVDEGLLRAGAPLGAGAAERMRR